MELKQTQIKIDLNRLSYGAYMAYLKGEYGHDLPNLLAQVVVAWPFETDPSIPASYNGLGLLDLLAVQAALRDAIGEAVGGNSVRPSL